MNFATFIGKSIFTIFFLGMLYFIYSSYFKDEIFTSPHVLEPITETFHATTGKKMPTEDIPLPSPNPETKIEVTENEPETQTIINQVVEGKSKNENATTTVEEVEENVPMGYRCFWGVKAGVTESDPIYVAYLDNSNKVFRYESRIPLDMSYPRQGTLYELTDFLPKNTGQYSSVKIYRWSTTSNNGQYKIETTDEPILEEDLDYLEDLQGDPDYTCVPWDIDTQLLTPPANITFTEKK